AIWAASARETPLWCTRTKLQLWRLQIAVSAGVASWSKLRRTARAARPRCVTFDLDGCLWHPAMAKLRGEGLALHVSWPGGGGAPFHRCTDNSLRDRRGEHVQLYDGVLRALADIVPVGGRCHGALLAVASCCEESGWADACLKAFEFSDGRCLDDLVDLKFYGRWDEGFTVLSAVFCHLASMCGMSQTRADCWALLGVRNSPWADASSDVSHAWPLSPGDCKIGHGRLRDVLRFLVRNRPKHCSDAAELGATAVDKLVQFLHLKAEQHLSDKAQALLWRCAAEGRSVHPFGVLAAAEVRRAVGKFEQLQRRGEEKPQEPASVTESRPSVKPRSRESEEASNSRDGQNAGKTSARPQVVKDIALYLRSQTPKRRGSSEQILRTAAKRQWDVAGYSNLSRDEVEKAIFLGAGKRVTRPVGNALGDASATAKVEIGNEENQQSKAKAVAQRRASPSKSKEKEKKEVKGAWGHVVDALRSERPRSAW
ncbi:Pol, partial [Symbiodinium sp. CCMP2456]